MKDIIILAATLSAAQVYAQDGERWYKVTASNNKMWSVAQNISITQTGSDTVFVLGFSNQGALVRGTVGDGRITIPRQTATIIPFGGDGKLQWDIVAEGNGNITDTTMEMQFYFSKDSFETTGEIKAVRSDGE